MIEHYDEDSNGEIDFAEFTKMMAGTILEPEIEPEMMSAFKVFDRYDQGISPMMLQEVMAKFGYPITNQEANDIVNENDWDGCGTLDYAEFARIMLG